MPNNQIVEYKTPMVQVLQWKSSEVQDFLALTRLKYPEFQTVILGTICLEEKDL